MSAIVKGKNGQNVVLLNPQEKRDKFFAELQGGVRLTNSYEIKKSDKGRKMKLTKEQRAYRAGYIQAQNDSAKCFKANNKTRKVSNKSKKKQ